MNQKVLAYVSRLGETGLEVLVYTCPGPGGEVCLPGGLLEFGEREEEALYRVIEEGVGLVHLRFIQKLGSFVDYQGSLRQSAEYHAFHVTSLESPPAIWQHRVPSYAVEEEPLRRCFWLSLDDAQAQLGEPEARFISQMLHPSRAAG